MTKIPGFPARSMLVLLLSMQQCVWKEIIDPNSICLETWNLRHFSVTHGIELTLQKM